MRGLKVAGQLITGINCRENKIKSGSRAIFRATINPRDFFYPWHFVPIKSHWLLFIFWSCVSVNIDRNLRDIDRPLRVLLLGTGKLSHSSLTLRIFIASYSTTISFVIPSVRGRYIDFLFFHKLNLICYK